MPERSGDWLRQAERDLEHARRSALSGDHEWACFAAQQAAEKALKALHQALGGEGWGHSIMRLLNNLSVKVPIDDDLPACARFLDKLYIPTRYPNGLPTGAPADYYTHAESERAIADAEAIVVVCQGIVSG